MNTWQEDRNALADQAANNRRARAQYDQLVRHVLAVLWVTTPDAQVKMGAIQHALKMRSQGYGRTQVRASLRRLKLEGFVIFDTATQGHARCFYKPAART